MRNKWKIRSAKLDDLHGIKKLLLRCNLPIEGLDGGIEEAFCVALMNKKIIGVGGIEIYSSHGLLRSVAVAPSWQGKSIGESIIKDRLAWAKSRALSDVFLLTIDATKYFERFRFSIIDRNEVPAEIRESSEFSSVCPKSAFIMILNIKEGFEA